MNPPLTLAIVEALANRAEIFTVTRVEARVAPTLGGYKVAIEGDPVEVLQSMAERGQLGDILAISGVAHLASKPAVAFRLDAEGAKVAANAPDEVVTVVAPALKQLAGIDD